MSRNQAFRLAGEIELQALKARMGRGEVIDTAAQVPALNKYHNVKTNGYASSKEAKRAEELKLLFHAGQISDLVEQPEFVLVPPQDGERAVKYRADFGYYDLEGKRHVEDVKGFRTEVFKIKKKLMLFIYGICVEEL